MTRKSVWCLLLTMTWACGGDDDDSGTSNATTMTTTMGDSSSGGPTSAESTNGSTNGTTNGTTVGTTMSDDGPIETGPAETGPADTGPSEESGPTEETGIAETGPAETSGGGALDNCLMMAADECEECACNNCLMELMACQADPGCVEIRMCAQENDCTGIECLGPCGDVINMNGGPLGMSAGLASTLSDCYTGACPEC